MKDKCWLSKRESKFYSLDSETRERKSLSTSNRHEAQKIIQAKNEATGRPALGLSLAKAYLAAYFRSESDQAADHGQTPSGVYLSLTPFSD